MVHKFLVTATSRAWKLSIPRCNCSKVKKMVIPSAYRGGNTALWGDPCYTRQYADTRGFIKREGAVDNGQVTSADIWRCVQSNKQPLEWVEDASCATAVFVPSSKQLYSDKWMNCRAKIEFKWTRHQTQLGPVSGLSTHLCSHVGLLLLLLLLDHSSRYRPGQCFKLDSISWAVSSGPQW